jgi:hypothetical protein
MQRPASRTCWLRNRQKVRTAWISGGGKKQGPQQTIGVQLAQPLTFLHITLSSRHVLGAPCVHQVHFQTLSLQHIMEGNPINSRRLQHHRADATTLEPTCHFF